MVDKVCTRCGELKPQTLEFFGQRKTQRGFRWDSWCKSCYAANTRRTQRVDPERKRQADKEWRERNSVAYKERQRLYWERLPETQKEQRKRHAQAHNRRLKREALEYYGGALCKCCGETELLMLSLDHIASDGAAHRKALTGKTRTMPQQSYIWAKKNGWPPIYQVMCFNCNWARHWNNGICPHQIACPNILELAGNARINQAA